MSEERSKCCGLGVMTPEDYIHYNGEDSLGDLDPSTVDWICAECGNPTKIKEDTMRKSALKKVNFPEFETMISAMDFQKELVKLLDLRIYDREKVESVFGVKIFLDAFLPSGTALLIKDDKIVAVIQDQTVTEVKGWKITKLKEE